MPDMPIPINQTEIYQEGNKNQSQEVRTLHCPTASGLMPLSTCTLMFSAYTEISPPKPLSAVRNTIFKKSDRINKSAVAHKHRSFAKRAHHPPLSRPHAYAILALDILAP